MNCSEKKASFLADVSEKRSVCLIGPLARRENIKSLSGPFLAIDGGSDKLSQQQLSNTFSIGDGDSSKNSLDLNLPKEKDFSDLAAGLDLLETCELDQIFTVGFFGERKDHELCNLAEFFHFLNRRSNSQHSDCIISWTSGAFLGTGHYQLSYHSTFTLMNFALANFVTLVGDITYPLGNQHLRYFSSHGLSNQAFGNFKLTCSAPLLVFFSGPSRFSFEVKSMRQDDVAKKNSKGQTEK